MVNPVGSSVDELDERRKPRHLPKAYEWDGGFVKRILPLMDIFNSYFDSQVRGLEKLPASGPMLLVGNHSGGSIVPDTVATLSSWYHVRGVDEPLLGLAFDAMFDVPGLAQLMKKLGEVPANHENAEAALRAGASVLVYPGGAHEAFRPWHDRNRIDFDSHQGFIKLALRTGVPVVPVVAHGGQHTVVVLNRGDEMAKRIGKWFGMDRYRIKIMPILWQIPWGVSIPLQMGLPLPAKIDVEVLDPIDWSRHGAQAAEDPAVLDACYAEITERMQATLDRLARNRPYPVVDRMLALLPKRIGQIFRSQNSSEGEEPIADASAVAESVHSLAERELAGEVSC